LYNLQYCIINNMSIDYFFESGGESVKILRRCQTGLRFH
jgi:hypothetical protein